MVRNRDDMPVWRALGAALAAFCLGAQLLVSGLLLGGMVQAAGDVDLGVICSHDGQTDPASGVPDPHKSHHLCPACTCAPSHQLASPLPQAPLLAVLRGRSEPMPVRSAAAGADRHLHSPYASRAPPRTA
jgi:hypothetical protein